MSNAKILCIQGYLPSNIDPEMVDAPFGLEYTKRRNECLMCLGLLHVNDGIKFRWTDRKSDAHPNLMQFQIEGVEAVSEVFLGRIKSGFESCGGYFDFFGFKDVDNGSWFWSVRPCNKRLAELVIENEYRIPT